MTAGKMRGCGLAALLLWGFGAAAQTMPAGELWRQRPHVRLGAEGFWVDVLLPDKAAGHYRGPRFVHGGMVAQVTMNPSTAGADERTYLAQASPRDEPAHFDANAAGLAEEFSDPIGFEEAVITDRDPEPVFMKIGVGLLGRNSSQPYRFFRPYPLKEAGAWAVVRGENDICFTQSQAHPGGWGYLYTVRVVVDAPSKVLRVERMLSNTGTKEIRTRHYAHHFFSLRGPDMGPEIGPGYELVLDWPAELEAGSTLEAAAKVESTDGATVVKLTKVVAEKTSVHSYLETQGKNARRVALRREGTGGRGQSVAVVAEQPIDRVLIWGNYRAFCPETFTDIALLPGEQKSWAGQYTFEAR